MGGTAGHQFSPRPANDPQAVPEGFAILLDEANCLVVAKPAGVLTQAPPGIDSLEQRVRQYLARTAPPEPPVYLGVPHRLDRAVSGAMVFATHIRAARKLSRQFERRTVEKIYWACVEGEVSPPRGTWRDTMHKVPGMPRAVIVDPEHPKAQTAVLHYRVIGHHPWGSWLEIILETGRTHQVRIQAASRGHILLGDAYYDSKIPFGPQHDDDRARAIALHARGLAFDLPGARERVSVVAPLPEAWQEISLEPAADEGPAEK